MAEGIKEFSAKVPEEEYERFRKHLPMYGAVNWFINTALKEFNDRLEANPSLRANAVDAIDQLLVDRREITNDSIRSGT